MRNDFPTQGKQGNLSGREPRPRVAVVLFQLGGPDSPQAIEPFLYNLFSDPDIIDFPFARLARPVMARLIASRRARKVQEHYAHIGGYSPLRELTERQAAALEADLNRSLDARVFVAMRYWHPLTEEAVRQVIEGNFEDLVLLPLYPQYSSTTTGSSLNEWNRQYPVAAGKRALRPRVVREFYDDPGYLEAMVARIAETLENFAASHEDVHLLFSAHGLPLSVIEAGDPYQEQIEATSRLIMARGGWPNPSEVCYQSRVSPGRWLEPTLAATLERLAGEGARRALVVPVAFVSEHVETLHEIDQDARHLAYTLGFADFAMMPALNDSPLFIRALAERVLREVAEPARAG